MKKHKVICGLWVWALWIVTVQGASTPQWQDITPGPHLEGWAGDSTVWHVENGVLIGRTTRQHPLAQNTFLVWKGGRVRDFELRFEFRLLPQNPRGWANSGVEYRAWLADPKTWAVGGYQADMDAANRYTGILFEERGRGILSEQGQKIRIGPNGKRQVIGQIAEAQTIRAKIQPGQWNSYRILAVGNRLIHEVNGQVVTEVVDEDPQHQARSGILALQLHRGEPMEVQFRNLRLREIHPIRRIVLIAGRGSHGRGTHAFWAGMNLLKKCLERLPGLEVSVHYRWPEDPGILKDADAVVLYSDGGGAHPLLQDHHLDQIRQAIARGAGFGCMHYALDVRQETLRKAFLEWIGGYYETWWSVNPTWTANFQHLPHHPVTHGVMPFRIHDEWYYHMRFVPGMKGVTPILAALPPPETLRRPEGPHSNNPYVRKEVLEEKKPQVVMWVYERPDGARGFGFTGGHYHKNWGDENFRKVVLNAILWIARTEVPKEGVNCTITKEDLEQNLGR